MAMQLASTRESDPAALLAARVAAQPSQMPVAPQLRALQAEALAQFRRQGLPHPKSEDWKYTDLRRLMSFEPREKLTKAAFPEAADVLFLGGAALTHEVSGAARVETFQDVMAAPPAWFMARLKVPETAIGALNLAAARQGAVHRFASGEARPLTLRCVLDGATEHVRHVLAVDPGVSANLIEWIDGRNAWPLATVAHDIHIDAGARLNHIRIVEMAAGATLALESDIAVDTGGHYALTEFRLGDGCARTSLTLALRGEGAAGDLALAAAGEGTAHFDWHGRVRHLARATKSRIAARSVLGGQALGAIQACVSVAREAQLSDSHQLIKAMVMSPRAVAIHKPELEILADDVKCGHGATTGGFDLNQLFYLQSRGLPEAEAQGLLLNAFMDDILIRLPEPIAGVLDGRLRTAFMAMGRA